MHYTQAIDKEGDSFAIYYNRAVTLVKMDAIDEAKSDLLRSLEINPTYIPSLCQLGFVYLYQGNTPASLETYVRAVKANMELPNQLNRFKAQLKEAIRLAESRCKQQEYPQEFIDSIITPDIRATVDSYPNLPTHMVESGIPPVAFGNVPISHGADHTAAIIARASIPIPLNGVRAATTSAVNPVNTTTPAPSGTGNNSDVTAPTGANLNATLARALNIPGLADLLNAPGVSASVSIGGPQAPQELMDSLGELTNTELTANNTFVTTNAQASSLSSSTSPSPSPLPASHAANVTPAPQTPATTTTTTTPTVIHAPITRSAAVTSTGLPADLLERHRAAHQTALNRAAELRRERANAASSSTSTVPDPEIGVPEPASPSPAAAAAATAAASTTNTTTGTDFARHFAQTIATQLTNAASQHAGQVAPGATPNTGAIQSLAQNLTSIASGVLGGLATGNNIVSMVTNSNGDASNNSDGHTGSVDAEGELDLEMDLD